MNNYLNSSGYDEKQLEQLLAYHSRLVDDELIDSIILKIDNAFQFRQWVLGIFTLFGFIAGMVGFSALWPSTKIVFDPHLMGSYSPLYMTLIVFAVVCFFTWIFNEEFEVP